MLFNSLTFAIFFPVVTIGYFVLPHKFRWAWLLLASCYFYMAFIPIYILILFFTISVDYIAGLAIASSHGRRRKFFLIASIAANIGVLAFFKYFNFFNANLSALGHALGLNYPIPFLNIILPIGLSFHTFQSMSYTIEVYRGAAPAEKHLGIFALYVMFYPQLVAGPIERPQHLLPQFHTPHAFDYQRVTDGLKLMAWGLFKKMVIADRLAALVNQVYVNPIEFQGMVLILTLIFFSFQIYCDFSGYSDIAIGAAQVMGIRLMTNFKRPYFSRSISEFWQRWHISLSSWFRDYFYIPLGGNRVSQWRWQFNLLATFLVSGLWHGASWTFVLWGGLHGLYLIASNLMKNLQTRIPHVPSQNRFANLRTGAQIGLTFGLVSLAWVLFRAASISDAWYILTHLIPGFGNPFDPRMFLVGATRLSMNKNEIVFALGTIGIMLVIEFFQERGSIRAMLAQKPTLVRWAFYYALVMSILFFGIFAQREFIYFQF